MQIRALARRFSRQADTGEAIGRLRAPAMDGLDIVLIQGTDTASLQKGPGHFPETAFPGQGETVGIAGHRTTYLAPFRHIDSMERGDRIVLEMPYATIVYRVQKTEIVDPTDVGVVDTSATSGSSSPPATRSTAPRSASSSSPGASGSGSTAPPAAGRRRPCAGG